jgi:hypothetical protein
MNGSYEMKMNPTRAFLLLYALLLACLSTLVVDSRFLEGIIE